MRAGVVAKLSDNRLSDCCITKDRELNNLDIIVGCPARPSTTTIKMVSYLILITNLADANIGQYRTYKKIVKFWE